MMDIGDPKWVEYAETQSREAWEREKARADHLADVIGEVDRLAAAALDAEFDNYRPALKIIRKVIEQARK